MNFGEHDTNSVNQYVIRLGILGSNYLIWHQNTLIGAASSIERAAGFVLSEVARQEREDRSWGTECIVL